MTLGRLKWIAFVGLGLFLVLFDLLRTSLQPQLRSLGARLLLDVMLLTGAVFLLGLVFEFVGRLQYRLERQNAELMALHHAALDLSGELALDTVLRKVVEGARLLLGARYGALSVYDHDGKIGSFVTAGLSPEQHAQIGAPPVGRGLLGLVLGDGQPLRLPRIGDHPASIGFPPNHPPMSSLLAVPIGCRSPFRGNLYLTDKESEGEFSESDEATLTRFAAQAALAIDTSYLHEQLRTIAVAQERLRIAHEMHDGMAQVLAYVNTKAQAVRELLRGDRAAEAGEQLDQLAAAAREVYSDVREGIGALRVAGSGEEPSLAAALRTYVTQWQDHTGIKVEYAADEEIHLAPEIELQLIRIVQEALANVRKHSAARRVRVALTAEGRQILVEVEDDGKGFEDHEGRTLGFPRFGLATMRERAQGIGGEFEIESRKNSGTCIRVRIERTRMFATFQGGGNA